MLYIIYGKYGTRDKDLNVNTQLHKNPDIINHIFKLCTINKTQAFQLIKQQTLSYGRKTWAIRTEDFYQPNCVL